MTDFKGGLQDLYEFIGDQSKKSEQELKLKEDAILNACKVFVERRLLLT